MKLLRGFLSFKELRNMLNHIFRKIIVVQGQEKILGCICDFYVNSCSSNCFACDLKVYSIHLIETVSWWKHLDLMWL